MTFTRLLASAVLPLALFASGCSSHAALTGAQLSAAKKAAAVRAKGMDGSAAGLRGAGQRMADAAMAAYDKNGDGQLGPDEFTGFALPQLKVALTFNAFDSNHDGLVTGAELAAGLESPGFVQALQQWWYQDFQQFDADQNDQLSRPEFDQLLKTSGLRSHLSVTNFFDADTNGDGQLNPSEYEDLGFGTYVDFVVVPFLQQGGRDAIAPDPALAPLRLPVLLPPMVAFFPR